MSEEQARSPEQSPGWQFKNGCFPVGKLSIADTVEFIKTNYDTLFRRLADSGGAING